MHAATRIRRGLGSTKALQLQGLARLQGVVISLGIVAALVNRNDRIDHLVTPTRATPIDFPGTHHIRLPGENEDFDWLFFGMGECRNDEKKEG